MYYYRIFFPTTGLEIIQVNDIEELAQKLFEISEKNQEMPVWMTRIYNYDGHEEGNEERSPIVSPL